MSDMSIAFLITTFLLTVAPGTGVVYTVASGLSRGRRAGLLAAVACTLGMIPHFVAALTGVAAVLHANPMAFRVLTWVGAAYLLYLGWQMWRDRGSLEVTGDDAQADAGVWAVIRTGITINLLNPKLTAFFFAFLPQFVPVNEPQPIRLMALLGATAVLMTLVVFAGYALAASAVREKVLARPRVMDVMRRVFSVTFVALAARLALTPA